MKLGSISTFILRLSLLTALLTMVASAQDSAKPTNTAADVPAASRIQPAELVTAMKSPEKPALFYVGPKAFYAQGHISGAEYVGPVGKPEGMAALRTRVASLPKNMPVVIYCGCCPWDHCPNIRPAFAELKKEGFSNVRVLYLATSFGVDWKDKGLPVASGE